jgi:hypothetical protein
VLRYEYKIHKAADLTQPVARVDGSLKLPWFSHEAKVLFDLGMMQEGFKAKLTYCLPYRQYSLDSVCEGLRAGEELVQIKLDPILDASKHTYCDL